MPELNEDLWPADLGITSIVTPVAILRSQAALLAEKTKGVLEGVVESSSGLTSVHHQFVVLVPAMSNYRYTLLRIDHDPVVLYPITVEDEPGKRRGLVSVDTGIRLNDEAEFRDWLRRALASDATKRIIASLYSQAAGQ